MDAAIYARVSTSGQTQSLNTQLELCRRAASLRGLDVVMEVSEVVSGTAAKLPERAALLQAVRAGRVRTLIVARLDRFGRSLIDLLAILKEMNAIGANFISVEDGIDFSTPAGQLQANLLAVIAEFEKRLIRERTEEGRQAARSRGVRFGRKPILADDTINEIGARLRLGHSQSGLAKEFGVERSVIRRIRRKQESEDGRMSLQKG